MWIAFSLFLHYFYVKASVQCKNSSHNDNSYLAIPNMPGFHWTKWYGLWPPYIDIQLSTVTTVTTIAAAGGNGPLAPHMRPCTTCWHVKWMSDNPPSKQIYFLEGWGCVWPLKCSFVPTMMHYHNIGAFWGPYTSSTPQRSISACSASLPLSIGDIGLECKASCGVLGGHFHRVAMVAMVVLVIVCHWRLRSDWPTVGIIKNVYNVDPIHSWQLTW